MFTLAARVDNRRLNSCFSCCLTFGDGALIPPSPSHLKRWLKFNDCARHQIFSRQEKQGGMSYFQV